jgi:hypothetical protein
MFERLTRMFGTDDGAQGTDAREDDERTAADGTDGDADADEGAHPDDPTAAADAGMEWQSGDLPADGAGPGPTSAEADGGTAPDRDPGAVAGATTEELDVRIDELEEELESTGASVRAIQSSQEEMADAVEEVNDTVRRLVGVYDRLAAEQNPFLDGPDEAADGASVVGDAAAAGGTAPTDDVGPDGRAGTEADGDADDGVDDVDDDAAHDAPDAADAADAATNGEDDGVVSFADLRDGGPGDGSDGPVDGGDAGDGEDGRGERPADSPFGPGSGGTTNGRGTAAPSGAGDGPLLAALPDGYAGEVVAMEWLSTLMAESGAAGAVRAVEHYEDAGWISPAVTRRLVDVVAAPGIDDAGPDRLREPTAADHARSYGYVRVLRRLTEE